MEGQVHGSKEQLIHGSKEQLIKGSKEQLIKGSKEQLIQELNKLKEVHEKRGKFSRFVMLCNCYISPWTRTQCISISNRNTESRIGDKSIKTNSKRDLFEWNQPKSEKQTLSIDRCHHSPSN
jgi:hypothetical protein